jgi:hypothetical protein
MAHTVSKTLCDDLIFKPSMGSFTSHPNDASDMTFSSKKKNSYVKYYPLLQSNEDKIRRCRHIYAMQAHMASASDSSVILHLVTRLRTPGAVGYLHSPISHHGNVRNAACSNFSNCTFHYRQIKGKGKGKGKIHRRTGHEDPEGE